jgi:hypothetical protein
VIRQCYTTYRAITDHFGLDSQSYDAWDVNLLGWVITTGQDLRLLGRYPPALHCHCGGGGGLRNASLGERV